MNSVIENTPALIVTVCIGMFFFWKIRKKKIDASANYDDVNLGGKIGSIEGITCLWFKYDKFSEPRKLQYIIDNYTQGLSIIDEHGYEYQISELLNKKFYDIEYDLSGKVSFKEGPFVLYKLIPVTELKQTNFNFGNNGPVVVANNNSVAHVSVVNSSFNSKILEYRDKMIEVGVLDEDIDILLENSENSDVKQSFFGKYGIDLVKIMVDVSGQVINLLAYLRQ